MPRPAIYNTLDPNLLRELYHGQQLTQSEIGQRLGVSSRTISMAMRHFNIPARHKGHRPAAAPPHDDHVDADCNPDCPYFDVCLEWPVDTPCPVVRSNTVPVQS